MALRFYCGNGLFGRGCRCSVGCPDNRRGRGSLRQLIESWRGRVSVRPLARSLSGLIPGVLLILLIRCGRILAAHREIILHSGPVKSLPVWGCCRHRLGPPMRLCGGVTGKGGCRLFCAGLYLPLNEWLPLAGLRRWSRVAIFLVAGWRAWFYRCRVGHKTVNDGHHWQRVLGRIWHVAGQLLR